MKWKVRFCPSFLIGPGCWVAIRLPYEPDQVGMAFDTWREAYDYAFANGEMGSP